MGSAGSPRFACDVMLGRLARWLRTLGYDATYDSAAQDEALRELSAREHRLLLSRDAALIAGAGAEHSRLLRSDRPLEQLRELAAAGLLRPSPRPFRRCTRCNVPLRRAGPGEIEDRVPEHVRRTHEDFRSCPRCRRVYWRGTHRDRMEAALAALLPALSGDPPAGRRRGPG